MVKSAGVMNFKFSRVVNYGYLKGVITLTGIGLSCKKCSRLNQFRWGDTIEWHLYMCPELSCSLTHSLMIKLHSLVNRQNIFKELHLMMHDIVMYLSSAMIVLIK